MFSFIYVLQLIPILTRAVLVNVTVDDSGTDPISGEWITYTAGGWKPSPCSTCVAQPDKAHMFNMTWHDGTYYPANSSLGNATGPLNAMFMFNGSAIYVFCAIALESDFGISNMTFFIDGENYDVLVYSNTSLAPRPHQFTLQNGEFGNEGNVSFTLFDYLIYSYDDGSEHTPTSTTTEPHGPSKTATVAVAGVIGGLAIGLLTWLLLRFRKARHDGTYNPFHSFRSTSSKPVPYTFNSTSSRTVVEPNSEYLVMPDLIPRYGIGIQKSDGHSAQVS
ncbi:hypothetical protein BDQ17DRAFT_1373849 [Cyathus striatus]|nr:hypothetical protein BDQ17DRAFT_1373849 [Cyathus striatus]